MDLTPGRGWVEVKVAATPTGVWGGAEVGYHLRQNLAIYGYGAVAHRDYQAGAGLRYVF